MRQPPYHRYFKGNRFIPMKLARCILKRGHFLSSPIDQNGQGTDLLTFGKGVYQPNGEAVARGIAHRLLKSESKIDRLSQVIALMKEESKLEESRLNHKAKELVNVSNGMLNWKTGELSDHSPQYLSTIQLPVAFDPSAKSPLLDRFLREVLPSDALALFEEVIGYLLLPSTIHQKAFLFLGQGANGKSTCIRLIVSLIGENNCSHESLQDLSNNKFRAAELQGKLVNTFDDLDRHGFTGTSKFKVIVSGEPLSVEGKFKNPTRISLFTRLLFSANQPPYTTDKTEGYFRRLVMVPFPNVFKEGQRDLHMAEKLSSPVVLSALLNKALNGLRRLEDNGCFSTPATSMRALEGYRRTVNPIYEYLSKNTKEDPEGRVPCTDLLQGCIKHCLKNGFRIPTKRSFKQQLKELRNVTRSTVRKDGKRKRAWLGIAWKKGNVSRR
jgi:putative DNA primase/helicase